MIAAWTTLTRKRGGDRRPGGFAARAGRRRPSKLIGLEKRSLAILQLRLQRGDASGLDVAAQQSQLAQAQATLPALVKQLAADGACAGRPDRPLPGPAADRDPLAERSAPARRICRSACPRPWWRNVPTYARRAPICMPPVPQIGIAAAQRLPNIQLTADAGSSALAISQLFTSGTGFWGIAASLTAPIFQGGQLLHQQRAARGRLRGSRATVSRSRS